MLTKVFLGIKSLLYDMKIDYYAKINPTMNLKYEILSCLKFYSLWYVHLHSDIILRAHVLFADPGADWPKAIIYDFYCDQNGKYPQVIYEWPSDTYRGETIFTLG